MNGNEFRREIEMIFNSAREKCPNVTDDMLDTNGTIYYMNGNDSTPFDWNCNGRLCEFYIFHKNEMGFIKALVNNDNTVNVYIYETDNIMEPTYEFIEKMENINASSFANLMNYIADDNGLYNKPIDDFDWNIDTSECYDISDTGYDIVDK